MRVIPDPNHSPFTEEEIGGYDSGAAQLPSVAPSSALPGVVQKCHWLCDWATG